MHLLQHVHPLSGPHVWGRPHPAPHRPRGEGWGDQHVLVPALEGLPAGNQLAGSSAACGGGDCMSLFAGDMLCINLPSWNGDS